MTTSAPASRAACAAASIANVLPTPAVAPKKIRSRPRRARASSALTCARSSSGSGRASTAITPLSLLRADVERQVQLEDVDARLAEHAERATLRVLTDERRDLCHRQVAGARHARDLVLGCGDADVRVEPASRRGH